MNDRLKRFLKFCLLVVVFFIAATPIWFPRLGYWLVVSDPIEKSDIIVVLGGGDPQRAIVGAKYFKDGFAGEVVTTGAPIPDYAEALGYKLTFAELGAKLVSLNGVPPRNITAIKEGWSTFDEANIIRKYMESKGMKSAIVVSTVYHTRRTRLVFNKAFKDSGIKIIVRPAEGGQFTVDKWWTREEDLVFVQNEYIKLIMYAIQGKI